LVAKSFGTIGGIDTATGSLNVFDAFATTNNSHHAVRGAKYSTATLTTPYQSLRQAGLLPTSGTILINPATAGVADNSTLHCNDCHSTGYSSHGSANEYLLQTATEENPTTEHLAITSYVCMKCHTSSVYSGLGSHVGNGSDYQPQSNTTATGSSRLSNTGKGMGHITGIACLNCHDGAQPFGGVHGVGNSTYSAGGSGGTYQRRRFMPGSGLRNYDPQNGATTDNSAAWEGTASRTNQCYTLSGASSYSACTQHGGGTGGAGRNTSRPTTY
jgi:hypothetical protein